jgi:hypothetical protein
LSQAVEIFSRLNTKGRSMTLDQMVSALTYREVKNVVGEVKGSDVTLWDSLTRKRKNRLGAVGGPVMLDTLHHAAALGREQNTGAAQAVLEAADLLSDATLMTALEALLNVLPPPGLAGKGKPKDDDGGLSGASSDFEALERLRRLAFAEDVPAPHIQLELALEPAEAQGELGFGDTEGDEGGLDGDEPGDE